jgi:hypothetical protein
VSTSADVASPFDADTDNFGADFDFERIITFPTLIRLPTSFYRLNGEDATIH